MRNSLAIVIVTTCRESLLRSALTLLADSEIVVYLDDDDWFKHDHCARILHAIDGKKWAYSYSIYADANTVKACVSTRSKVSA